MRRPDVIRDINIGCNCQLGLINKGWMTASDRVYISPLEPLHLIHLYHEGGSHNLEPCRLYGVLHILRVCIIVMDWFRTHPTSLMMYMNTFTTKVCSPRTMSLP